MNRTTLLVLLLLLLLPLSALTPEDEYIRKAALLQKISNYIEWPEEMGMNDKSKPFVIGVIGQNPFGPILEKAYSKKEKKIRYKKVEIKYISKPAEIANFHILFISSSMKESLPVILAVTSNKPVLTIGDTEGYAEKGVLFNFYIKENKIGFEINGSVLKKSPITIDPWLLRMATRIIRTTEEEK